MRTTNEGLLLLAEGGRSRANAISIWVEGSEAVVQQDQPLKTGKVRHCCGRQAGPQLLACSREARLMVTNTLGPMPIMVAMSALRLLSRSRRTTVVNTRVRSWKGIRKGACLQRQTAAHVKGVSGRVLT